MLQLNNKKEERRKKNKNEKISSQFYFKSSHEAMIRYFLVFLFRCFYKPKLYI